MKPTLSQIMEQLGESKDQGEVHKSRLGKRMRDLEEKLDKIDSPGRKRKQPGVIFLLLSLVVTVNWTLLAPVRWTYSLISSPLRRSVTAAEASKPTQRKVVFNESPAVPEDFEEFHRTHLKEKGRETTGA